MAFDFNDIENNLDTDVLGNTIIVHLNIEFKFYTKISDEDYEGKIISFFENCGYKCNIFAYENLYYTQVDKPILVKEIDDIFRTIVELCKEIQLMSVSGELPYHWVTTKLAFTQDVTRNVYFHDLTWNSIKHIILVDNINFHSKVYFYNFKIDECNIFANIDGISLNNCIFGSLNANGGVPELIECKRKDGVYYVFECPD